MDEKEEKQLTTVPTGPQIQRREKWIDLPDEYAGFRLKIWVNAPTKLWMAVNSASNGGSESEAQKAIEKIVLEHNGWRDFDGRPYPPPTSAEFWQEIPTELAACILVATQVEMSNLPNSMAPRKRR